MKIQIMGRKITENMEFKSPMRNINFFFSSSFHFQILHTKVDIFNLNHLLISCCHLVKKGLKQRCAVFYGEFENEKKKKKKDNICLIFQPEIKLKLASKRDMNLPKLFLPFTV